MYCIITPRTLTEGGGQESRRGPPVRRMRQPPAVLVDAGVAYSQRCCNKRSGERRASRAACAELLDCRQFKPYRQRSRVRAGDLHLVAASQQLYGATQAITGNFPFRRRNCTTTDYLQPASPRLASAVHRTSRALAALAAALSPPIKLPPPSTVHLELLLSLPRGTSRRVRHSTPFQAAMACDHPPPRPASTCVVGGRGQRRRVSFSRELASPLRSATCFQDRRRLGSAAKAAGTLSAWRVRSPTHTNRLEKVRSCEENLMRAMYLVPRPREEKSFVIVGAFVWRVS
jgi:hypothetical protein